MVERTNPFPAPADHLGALDGLPVPLGAPSASPPAQTVRSAAPSLVADDSLHGDCVLQGLRRLTLKLEPQKRNHWLGGARRSCLPAEADGVQQDSRHGARATMGSFHKLTLPMRDVGCVDKWAITAAVGAFLRNREIGSLDLTRCDPTSEVLHNLFGTEESEANPYVSGPIKELAKCVRFPRGMDRVPTWIELLWELDVMTLEDYQGECIDIKNQYLRQLNVSGPRIREIHVAETTLVRCREPGVRVYRDGSHR